MKSSRILFCKRKRTKQNIPSLCRTWCSLASHASAVWGVHALHIYHQDCSSFAVYLKYQYCITSNCASRFIMLLYVLVPKGRKKKFIHQGRWIYAKCICSLGLYKEAAQLHCKRHKPFVMLWYRDADFPIIFWGNLCIFLIQRNDGKMKFKSWLVVYIRDFPSPFCFDFCSCQCQILYFLYYLFTIQQWVADLPYIVSNTEVIFQLSFQRYLFGS